MRQVEIMEKFNCVTKSMEYRMTMCSSEKLSEADVITVVSWVHYKVTDDRGEVELLSIYDGERVYATNSLTFITSFFGYINFMGDEIPATFNIEVEKGISKNGRNYIDCFPRIDDNE